MEERLKQWEQIHILGSGVKNIHLYLSTYISDAHSLWEFPLREYLWQNHLYLSLSLHASYIHRSNHSSPISIHSISPSHMWSSHTNPFNQTVIHSSDKSRSCKLSTCTNHLTVLCLTHSKIIQFIPFAFLAIPNLWYSTQLFSL